MSELVKEVEQLESLLTARGWSPVPERTYGRKGKTIAAPSDGSAPLCPEHNAQMASSRYGGFYCTRRDDAGNYCKHKAK